jgi:hypothetical protein
MRCFDRYLRRKKREGGTRMMHAKEGKESREVRKGRRGGGEVLRGEKGKKKGKTLYRTPNRQDHDKDHIWELNGK